MSVTIRFDNGDFQFTPGGGQELIGGAEKAAQDMLHELFLPYDVSEDRGNEMFARDGGLSVMASTGSMGAMAVRSMLQSSVQRLQRSQSGNPDIDQTEAVQKISRLLVRSTPADPTSYSFLLNVQVNDENIGVARAIRTGHLGNTPKPLVGGYDP